MNELLKLLKEKDFAIFGYADDIAIIVRDGFFRVLRKRMMEALKIVQGWCLAKGLTINLNKTAAMVFTKKYKPESIEPFKLWGQDIHYTTSVKFLEVHLDFKLRWKQHLDKRKQLHIFMWACRGALGKI